MSNNALQNENKKLKEELEAYTEQMNALDVPGLKKKIEEQEVYIEELKGKQADFPTMKQEYDKLVKDYQTVTAERDTARKEVVEAGSTIRQLQASQPKRDDRPQSASMAELGVSPMELRSLAALCLPACKDEGGRAWNPATLEHNVGPYTEAAVAFAKELIRKTS